MKKVDRKKLIEALEALQAVFNEATEVQADGPEPDEIKHKASDKVEVVPLLNIEKDNARVYLQSPSYGIQRAHTITRHPTSFGEADYYIDILQEEQAKYLQRVEIANDQIQQLFRVLLMWELAARKQEDTDYERVLSYSKYDDDSLGDLDDHPF